MGNFGLPDKAVPRPLKFGKKNKRGGRGRGRGRGRGGAWGWGCIKEGKKLLNDAVSLEFFFLRLRISLNK